MNGAVYLVRFNPARNVRRFYKLFLAPSLFGDWVLVREWGRIGAGGTVKLDHFAHAGAALLALQELVRRKKREGYFPVREQPADQEYT